MDSRENPYNSVRNIRSIGSMQTNRSMSAAHDVPRQTQSKQSTRLMRPISNFSQYHTRNNLKLYKRSEASVRQNEVISQSRMLSERNRLKSAKFLQSQSPSNTQEYTQRLAYGMTQTSERQFEITKPAFTIKLDDLKDQAEPFQKTLPRHSSSNTLHKLPQRYELRKASNQENVNIIKKLQSNRQLEAAELSIF